MEAEAEAEAEAKRMKKNTKVALRALSKALAEIDHSDLETFVAEEKVKPWSVPEKQLLKLVDYYATKLNISFTWVNTFKLNSLTDLADVPFSMIPRRIYETSVSFINDLPVYTRAAFVLCASDLILTEWQAIAKVKQHNAIKSKVATFVALAIVLRSQPDALIAALPEMRERAIYNGEGKLPVTLWMIAQASERDLSVGLYSWTRNLVPLLDEASPEATDLILGFAEKILLKPQAQTILVEKADWKGERLVPPCSFEILVRLTFPASSARVEATESGDCGQATESGDCGQATESGDCGQATESGDCGQATESGDCAQATERFKVIYPPLKEVALAPDSATGSNTMKEIFTFSLKLAGEGNPVVAKEARDIAIRCVTENVDCFKQWDTLYEENIEASVALLRKLVDEWEDHSIKLLSSPSDTLIVKHTIYSFMMKNKNAIRPKMSSSPSDTPANEKGGVANCSLYREADDSCKLISGRLSRRCDGLKLTLVAAAAVAGAALVLHFS